MAVEDGGPPSGTPAATEALLALGNPQPPQDSVEDDSDDARWSPFYGINTGLGSDDSLSNDGLESEVQEATTGHEAAQLALNDDDVVFIEHSDQENVDTSAPSTHVQRSFTEIVGDLETSGSEYTFASGSSPELPLRGLLLAQAKHASRQASTSQSGLKITLPPLSKLGKASTGTHKASSTRSPLPAPKQRKSPVKKRGSSRSANRDTAAHRLRLNMQYKRQKEGRTHRTMKTSTKSATPHERSHTRAPIPDLAAAVDLFSDIACDAVSPSAREPDEQFEESENVPPRKVAKRAGPGRPPVKATPLTKYSVAAYIEVQHLREVQKTPRSKKICEPEIWCGGPVTITHLTTWPELLDAIARTAQVRRENLVITSLCWQFAAFGKSSKSALLPLTDEAGFNALIKEGILSCNGAQVLVLRMSPPIKPAVKAHHTVHTFHSQAPMTACADTYHPLQLPWATVASDEVPDWLHAGLVVSGESGGGNVTSGEESEEGDAGKKGKGKGKGKAKSKSKALSIDDLLAPIVEKLKLRYPVGCCPYHPGKRCFYHRGLDLHFELDNNRLLVWAASIEKGNDGVDYDHIPIHSKFFQASQALKVPLATAQGDRQGFRTLAGEAPPPPVTSHPQPYPAPGMPYPIMQPPPGMYQYPPMYGGAYSAPPMMPYYPPVMSAPQMGQAGYYPGFGQPMPGPSTPGGSYSMPPQ
ncbi:hypothetical protein BV20DRAFT_979584 [Pilatotrama ljubarskyi]|nr:hypothetical protein BV20DRAFT_979584 [Pilatotrama ljubarskyi]